MKKFVFTILASALAIALVLPACAGPPEENVIKIGVIGPMTYVQGEHHWWGAEIGRDTVNAAGGVTLNGEQYMIELIKADSNEMLSPDDAAMAMERLITVDGADFVIGGFRTEGMFPMQEVAMDYQMIFLDCGAATVELCQVVADDYDRYKYFFRVTPFCNTFLVSNTLLEVGMAGGIMKAQTGIQRPLRVAICAEGAEWADGMVTAMEGLIPAQLGMEVVGTWRPSPTATELTAEMTAIEASGADIIVTIISGPLGIPYARSWGELEVPAASIGINVESQKDGFWDATGGFGNYETTLNTYCEGVPFTEKTLPFIEAFKAKTGQIPTYTAGTNDAIILLAEAIERAGTLDADAVVVELEKTDFTGCGGPIAFTGLEDAPLGNPHDLVYGPGFATGIATQWQDGVRKSVWPNLMTGDWEGVFYEGTVMWQAPPRVIEKLTAEAATEPPPEEEAAPEEGALSFEAATYTNEEYGFSVQYPDDWVERPELVTAETILAAFGVPAFVPGVTICIYDADEPLSADWLVAAVTAEGNENAEVLSPLTETTLADGTPATECQLGYLSATGYDILSYALCADKDGKRVRVTIFTIDMFSPYDEALFSEIAHTLTFE